MVVKIQGNKLDKSKSKLLCPLVLSLNYAFYHHCNSQSSIYFNEKIITTVNERKHIMLYQCCDPIPPKLLHGYAVINTQPSAYFQLT